MKKKPSNIQIYVYIFFIRDCYVHIFLNPRLWCTYLFYIFILFYQRLLYHTCTYIFICLSCTYLVYLFIQYLHVQIFFIRDLKIVMYISFYLVQPFPSWLGAAYFFYLLFQQLIFRFFNVTHSSGASVLLLFAFSSVFVCSCACPLSVT